jgi:hypothetical protein
LSPEKEQDIKDAITKHIPVADFDVPLSTWTRKAVVALVCKRHKIIITERKMGDYLKD